MIDQTAQAATTAVNLMLQGIDVVFLTDNTSKARSAVVGNLKALGHQYKDVRDAHVQLKMIGDPTTLFVEVLADSKELFSPPTLSKSVIVTDRWGGKK